MARANETNFMTDKNKTNIIVIFTAYNHYFRHQEKKVIKLQANRCQKPMGNIISSVKMKIKDCCLMRTAFATALKR